MKVVQSTDTDKDGKKEMIYLRFWKIEEQWILQQNEQRRCSDGNSIGCSAVIGPL